VVGSELKQRLAAILAADAVAYSRLMSVDERGTVAALDAARALFRSHIESNHGRVIDMAGDSVLAVFDSAAGAVKAALDLQQALASDADAVAADRRMHFRIGVHLGDVIEKPDGTVYGDGVNIAARLQGLADAGGISVSEAVRGSVKTRIAATFEDLGEQRVKNMTEPVRAFRVKVGAVADSPPATFDIDPSTPDRPAIAVLPFANMSGDPEQEYFADGISEDLITDLSKLSGLLVIGRNSTFTYKGRSVDVRHVGREFGVSHVLEGSVRRAGNRLRITAQLLETVNAHHVWAERYDRGLEDVFAVQDEITRDIVAALDVKLLRGEQSTVWRKWLHRPEALDAYYRGLDGLNRITQEANAQAAQCFEQVVALEPESPLGHLGLAWVHLSASRYGWSDSAPASLKLAADLARKALALDEGCADAHGLLGYYHLLANAHDLAIEAGERSVALNPNHADNAANLACSYAVSSRPAQAVALIKRAMRLSPIYPNWYLNILGYAHYQLRQYEDADRALQQSLKREPAYTDSRLMLAGSYYDQGRIDDARREVQTALQHSPEFRLQDFENQLVIEKDRDRVAHYVEVLRSLGLQ
jgi:adenylate cyclase